MTTGVLQATAVGAAVAVLVAGCAIGDGGGARDGARDGGSDGAGEGGSDGGGDAAAGDPEGAAPSGELLVFAAASLTDVFGEMEVAFEAEHPDVDVRLNLAGSTTLREQILEGAPASVFASADEARMEEVVEAELVAGTPDVFASNSLTIAVPAGNPAEVTALGDLADPSLLVGACAVGVPCGDLSSEVFAAAGVDPSIDTYEPDVRSLLAKILDRELDTGLVYVTDVAARPDAAQSIPMPRGVDAATSYPIASLADAPNPVAAGAFVRFVLSPDGSRILADHGFGAP